MAFVRLACEAKTSDGAQSANMLTATPRPVLANSAAPAITMSQPPDQVIPAAVIRSRDMREVGWP